MSILGKPIDIVSIGDITTDAFIRLKEASVHCKVNTNDCEICMAFGDKIPFEYVKVVRAVGNAPNAAVSAARLGLRSALVANLGGDLNGKECMAELQRNNVITSFVKVHPNKPTNYHFVLWYDVDRTILVNHTDYNYELPDFPEPKWIYLTSLGGDTYLYHLAIADYLDSHPKVKLAFQPGTFQMTLGVEKMKRIYEHTEVVVVNVEEARRILKRPADPSSPIPATDETKPVSNPSGSDIKSLLKGLADLGPKIVIITDSTNGAYMFDNEHYYKVPMYPDPRPAFERTGCGDAFASTFVSAMAMGKPPLEALIWAPVNPMSVAQFIGAQEGLLTLDQVEWWLKKAPPEFKVSEI